MLPSDKQPRWYFTLAIMLLLIGAFFRLWHLGSAPPGMHSEELINVQLSQQMQQGRISVLYEEARPAREGLYFAILAISTEIIGKGLILWRLPSVWLSMLALAMIVTLLRRLFGVRIALLALGLLAVTFWPVWIGRSILHVTMIPLVSAFVIYALTRAYQATETTSSGLWFTVGGVSLGIAQYVHVTAWTLVILYIAFVGYRLIVDRREVRTHIGNVVYSLVLFSMLILPLAIFLTQHPGARAPVPIAEQPGLVAEIPERILSSLAGLALRGDMLPDHNIPGRPVFGPIIAVLMVIGVGVSIARWRQPAYGLALLWLIVGLIPTAFLPHKPDFEFMAVLLPVIFVFPAVGMSAIFYWVRGVAKQRRELAASAASAVVAFLILGIATRTYQDYFIVWPQLGDVRLNYQADLGVLARYLDTSKDSSPVSICTTPVDGTEAFAITNQELLGILMHRERMAIRYFDCTQSLVLANGGESQRIIFPRGHYYDHLPGPLLAWMRDAHDENVPGIRPDVVMRVDVSEQLADVAGAFITTAPTAWPPEAGSELVNLPVSFEGNITFLGYSVRDDTLKSTDWVEMTTYWRLDGPPPRELTMFAHLLGEPVVVIAQDDGLGVEISTLQARDVFLQYSMIQTPGSMAKSLYPLSVGLYWPSNSQRLDAFFKGESRANRLFLQRIEVTP